MKSPVIFVILAICIGIVSGYPSRRAGVKGRVGGVRGGGGDGGDGGGSGDGGNNGTDGGNGGGHWHGGHGGHRNPLIGIGAGVNVNNNINSNIDTLAAVLTIADTIANVLTNTQVKARSDKISPLVVPQLPKQSAPQLPASLKKLTDDATRHHSGGGGDGDGGLLSLLADVNINNNINGNTNVMAAAATVLDTIGDVLTNANLRSRPVLKKEDRGTNVTGLNITSLLDPVGELIEDLELLPAILEDLLRVSASVNINNNINANTLVDIISIINTIILANAATNINGGLVVIPLANATIPGPVTPVTPVAPVLSANPPEPEGLLSVPAPAGAAEDDAALWLADNRPHDKRSSKDDVAFAQPVQDTDEVKAAKKEFFKAFAEVLNRHAA